MTEPMDENEKERKKRTEGDSQSGSATSGIVRASSDGIVKSAQVESDEAAAKRKRSGEGEGQQGAVTSGIVRASGDGVVRLTVEQTKKVWADFRHLDLNEVVAAVAEFFSEFPARASANCVVAWENVRGIPIVNFAIKFGQDVSMAVRERTRESAVAVRRKYGINIKFKGRGASFTGPGVNPGGAGLS